MPAIKKQLTTRDTGLSGEEQAAHWLQAQGYDLLERNYRARRAEIDLIARHGDTVIFVEVKLRKTSDFGHPEDFVSEAQKARIRQAAETWLHDIQWQGPIRFDIIALTGSGNQVEIVHLPDAF